MNTEFTPTSIILWSISLVLLIVYTVLYYIQVFKYPCSTNLGLSIQTSKLWLNMIVSSKGFDKDIVIYTMTNDRNGNSGYSDTPKFYIRSKYFIVYINHNQFFHLKCGEGRQNIILFRSISGPSRNFFLCFYEFYYDDPKSNSYRLLDYCCISEKRSLKRD
jgi:hypothetical protein